MSRLAREKRFGTLPTREIEHTREAFVPDEGGIRPENSFVVRTSKAREGKRPSMRDVRVVRDVGSGSEMGGRVCFGLGAAR
jgi:hypothetical protein